MLNTNVSNSCNDSNNHHKPKYFVGVIAIVGLCNDNFFSFLVLLISEQHTTPYSLLLWERV